MTAAPYAVTTAVSLATAVGSSATADRGPQSAPTRSGAVAPLVRPMTAGVPSAIKNPVPGVRACRAAPAVPLGNPTRPDGAVPAGPDRRGPDLRQRTLSMVSATAVRLGFGPTLMSGRAGFQTVDAAQVRIATTRPARLASTAAHQAPMAGAAGLMMAMIDRVAMARSAGSDNPAVAVVQTATLLTAALDAAMPTAQAGGAARYRRVARTMIGTPDPGLRTADPIGRTTGPETTDRVTRGATVERETAGSELAGLGTAGLGMTGHGMTEAATIAGATGEATTAGPPMDGRPTAALEAAAAVNNGPDGDRSRNGREEVAHRAR